MSIMAAAITIGVLAILLAGALAEVERNWREVRKMRLEQTAATLARHARRADASRRGWQTRRGKAAAGVTGAGEGGAR